ncbi:hypothetical protein Droror1_Dr00010731 [Drosera rotundifolia]
MVIRIFRVELFLLSSPACFFCWFDELPGLCTAYEGKELSGKLQARLDRSPAFFADVTPRQAEVRSSPTLFVDAAPRQANVRSSPTFFADAAPRLTKVRSSPARFCPAKGDKVRDAPMVDEGTETTARGGRGTVMVAVVVTGEVGSGEGR